MTSSSRLTIAETAEIEWLDRLIAELKLRRRRLKSRSHRRTENWKRKPAAVGDRT